MIVTICGSQREGSFNQMLHDCAVKMLKKRGALVDPINLAELKLPLYDPNDEEDSFPPNAKTLKDKLVAADGIFIASPEYNGFTTPLLLNAITWATRGDGGMYDGFQGKSISVMATSPGPMGGLRMIRSLNTMLQDMGATVLPGHNSIGSAFKIFEKDGTIKDERTEAKIDEACRGLYFNCLYQANRAQECSVVKAFKLGNMGEYGRVDLPK